jgi:hypothetical protein
MGVHHDNGYSASVEGFFVTDGEQLRLAKSNGDCFVVVQPKELPPGIEGDLLVIIDGRSRSRRVRLPGGMHPGQFEVPYEETAPF